MESIQRVRVYLNERDLHEGRPLYLLALELLLREGATGATILRGMGGFGPGMRMRAASRGSVLDAQPIVLEWVDRVDRVAKILPVLAELLGEALITTEEIYAYRARLRADSPFGTRTVGDLLLKNAISIPAATGFRDALHTLLASDQSMLPVVDQDRHVLTVLSAEDLQRRGNMPFSLDVVRALQSDEQHELLEALPNLPLEGVLGAELRTSYVQASIPQTVATMLEWGLEALPVVDREGQFLGIIGAEQALQAAFEAHGPRDSAIRAAEALPLVRLLMQTSIQTIEAHIEASLALRQLLTSHTKMLVVVDAGRPVGLIDYANVLITLEPPLRYFWLQAIRSNTPPHLPESDPHLTAGMMAMPVTTITELQSQLDAMQLLIEQRQERLLVINEEGLLVGMLGRRALLRSLAQAS